MTDFPSRVLSALSDIRVGLAENTTTMREHEKLDQERHVEVCRRLGNLEAAGPASVVRKHDNRRAYAAAAIGGVFTLAAVVLTHLVGWH